MVQTHPIASALSLIGVMGSLAVLYLQLGGEFIAAAQVIVYAGAIMVLFIFVIMLLNAGAETRDVSGFALRQVSRRHPAGRFSWIDQLHHSSERCRKPRAWCSALSRAAPPWTVGRKLFTAYLLPFEVTSVLILIAIVGAIVLARKEV